MAAVPVVTMKSRRFKVELLGVWWVHESGRIAACKTKYW